MSSRFDVKQIMVGVTMLMVLNPLFSQKTYKGAEVYSKNAVLYGKFEMSMKMVKGSGMLSTFFTYKNSNGFWEEIDIEILGKNNANELSSNIITGPSTNTVNHQKSLYPGYTLADTFHTYTLEWTPEYVAWFIDSVELRRDTSKVVDELTSPETYRFNTWISCAPGWVGPIDRSGLPQYQTIDWIEYSRYDTGTFTFDWRDDFETFDDTRWSKATWTFDCNEVTFSTENITIESGKLVLALTDPNPPSPIDRINASESVEVMNNSSSGEFFVKLSENGTYTYHFYDLQGKTISVNEIVGNSFSIPYGDCKPGIYFLAVQSKDNAVTRKVLLE
jgi:endo-1,3-1,4-beta-glycanase ExoK